MSNNLSINFSFNYTIYLISSQLLFGCRVHGAFGMSETCPLIAFPELPADLDPETFRHRAHETWGFPMVGVEFKIVDEAGDELPWDGKAIGELLVRGDMVMKGYINKEEATRLITDEHNLFK